MARGALYCPIARAVDLLGDRWTLMLVRELTGGTRRFNEFARGLPGLSRGLLARRLRHLERSGIVIRADGEYRPTPAGEALGAVILALGQWGAAFAFGDPRPEELDPDLYVWWLHRGIDASGMVGRSVVRVDILRPPRRYWLVVEGGEASVCYTDPGFEVDVHVAAELATLLRLWQGRIKLADARADEALVVSGPRDLARRVSSWLTASPVAGLVRNAGPN